MSKTQQSKRTDEYKSVFGNAPKGTGVPGGNADWCLANCDLLTRLIGTVTSRGGAVRFGYTRDGGAYAIGFYYGSESTTEYCRPNEELDTFLEKWIDFYQSLPNTGGKAPKQE